MRQTWMKVLGAMMVCAMLGAFAGDDGTQPATPPAGGGAGGGGRGNRGNGGGNFDPAAFQQRMMDGIKTSLGVNDDEWKALQPKIEAVTKAQRDSRTGGGFGGFGNRGNRGGNNTPADTTNMTEVQKKSTSLRELLAKTDADPKEIQAALKAFRDEREKAREALKKAQSDLKELLTARQEAQLVVGGQLE